MTWTLALLAATCTGLGGDGEPSLGRLVILGGGPTTPEVRAKTLELAGGPKARVLIVPFASNSPTAGENSANFWRDGGAENVGVLDLTDPAVARAEVARADLIWIRGGSQVLLMRTMADTGVPEAIRERFHRGGIVAGTSAGAAVMSAVMITGYAGRRGTPEGQLAKLGEGLGLWPEVIVDQHFVKRKRHERLKRAVLDHPELLGIGIDESTAVVVQGRSFEVIGPSEVIVFDARRPATTPPMAPAPEPAVATAEAPGVIDAAMVVLKAGMTFDLDRGILEATAPVTAAAPAAEPIAEAVAPTPALSPAMQD